MVARKLDDDQGLLFGDSPVERALAKVPPAEDSPTLRALAAALPSAVRLGTSSWSFPGWRGLVYGRAARADELASFGIAAYGRFPLFRTVGLDRAFYALLARQDASALADLVPAGFRFLVKAHQSITRPDAGPQGSTFGDTGVLRSQGLANPRFLDPRTAAETVIAPLVEGMRDRLGPLVFQFPPLDLGPAGRIGGIERFIDRLGEFLSRLPKGPHYVVEVRNRELFESATCQRYARALAAGPAAHGFAVHPTLPPVSRQADALTAADWDIADQPICAVRWLLGHGLGYDTAKRRYEPFDRLVDADAISRSEIASLLRRALDAGRLAWVIANNKAEGSAPLTLEQLAREVAAPSNRAG